MSGFSASWRQPAWQVAGSLPLFFPWPRAPWPPRWARFRVTVLTLHYLERGWLASVVYKGGVLPHFCASAAQETPRHLCRVTSVTTSCLTDVGTPRPGRRTTDLRRRGAGNPILCGCTWPAPAPEAQTRDDRCTPAHASQIPRRARSRRCPLCLGRHTCPLCMSKGRWHQRCDTRGTVPPTRQTTTVPQITRQASGLLRMLA